MQRGDRKTGPAPAEARQAPDLKMVEIQVLLSMKRTALSSMRTGIAMFSLPLAVLTALIATSRYYDVLRIMVLLVPLLIFCAGLAIVAGLLILRAARTIHLTDLTLRQIATGDERLDRLFGRTL